MSRLALGRFKHAPDGCGRCVQTNVSVGDFCGAYDYEGCKNDPECVWCLEMTDSAAGCLHLSTSTVTHVLSLAEAHGDHSSWKVMEFSKAIFQAWKVMENSQGHGNSWKMMMVSWNFCVKMH